MSYAQTSAAFDNVVVIGSASVEVPADRVVISILLSFADVNDAKGAFEKHKNAEAQLAQFLRKAKVPDSLISYSLLSINQEIDYSRQPPEYRYVTHQSVKVVLTDVTRYSQFELSLVSLGFVRFSEHFESSGTAAGEREALRQAVQNARAKAELMAAAERRKITKAVKIMDTEETEPLIARFSENFGVGKYIGGDQQVGGLSSIPQTITISKQVKVIYQLE